MNAKSKLKYNYILAMLSIGVIFISEGSVNAMLRVYKRGTLEARRAKVQKILALVPVAVPDDAHVTVPVRDEGEQIIVHSDSDGGEQIVVHSDSDVLRGDVGEQIPEEQQKDQIKRRSSKLYNSGSGN